MSFWQFKFNNEDRNFTELKDLKDGDIFYTQITEDHVFADVDKGSVIFWDRTDKQKGIMLVTKIIGNPFETDSQGISTAKAIAVKVLKKFDEPFRLDENGFKRLHDKLNTKKYKGRVPSRAKIENKEGERLLNKILPEFEEPELNLLDIDKDSISKTLKLFLENYEQYIKDGKAGYYYNVFVEANITKQEIRHSAFLANLLKKDGNHFHNNLFFKNFIEELKEYESLKNCNVINNFDIQDYEVITEEADENEDDKGFMDIVIKDKEYMIIIENKTGTKDHKGQLLKYKEFAMQRKEAGLIKDFIILYLTPTGEDPQDEKAQDDEKIIPISYLWDIKNTMKNSLEEIESDRLYDIINQYIEAIDLYIGNFPIDWEYNLDIMNIIIQDIQTFKNCETITKLVNYNIIDKYDFSDEEIDIAKQVAKLFIKSKAYIELVFLFEFYQSINNLLVKNEFVFDTQNSSILVNYFQDDNLDTYDDVENIYKARKARNLIDISKCEPETVRYLTGNIIVYKKVIDENKILILSFLNDKYGFYSLCQLFDSSKDKENQNHLLANKTLLEPEIFSPSKIHKLIDKEYQEKLIKECKTKVEQMLKEVEV